MTTIHQLKAQRATLVERRQDVTASLAELRAKKSTMPAHLHATQHAALAATDARLNEQIVALNAQIRAAHQAEHPAWTGDAPAAQPAQQAKQPATPPEMTREEKRSLIQDIRDLRDHYEARSGNRELLPSIRTVSGECSRELSEIIRYHIKP